jgi:L-asparagine transporter-like permease
MAERAGISGLPHLINLVMILAAWSTATAEIYITVISFQLIANCDTESISTSSLAGGLSSNLVQTR